LAKAKNGILDYIKVFLEGELINGNIFDKMIINYSTVDLRPPYTLDLILKKLNHSMHLPALSN
jgi:hypothetical protein